MDATRTPLEPSPAAAAVLAFVNTRPRGGNEERLAGSATLRRWIERHGDPAVGSAELVTDADAATARELRAAVITLLLAHAGEADAPAVTAAEEYLRHCGRLYPLAPVVTAADTRLLPLQDGAAGQFAALLAAVGDLVRHDTWTRVKACRNPTCQLGFYDRTRNSSAAYCNPRTCGARVATRAYRSRKAQQAGSGD